MATMPTGSRGISRGTALVSRQHEVDEALLQGRGSLCTPGPHSWGRALGLNAPSSLSTCALSGLTSPCRHRIRLGDSESHYYISASSRARVSYLVPQDHLGDPGTQSGPQICRCPGSGAEVGTGISCSCGTGLLSGGLGPAHFRCYLHCPSGSALLLLSSSCCWWGPAQVRSGSPVSGMPRPPHAALPLVILHSADGIIALGGPRALLPARGSSVPMTLSHPSVCGPGEWL